MNINRIKELQDYANDFYKKLKYSEEITLSEDNKCIESYNKIIKKSFSTVVPKNRNLSFNRKSFSNYNIINGKNKLKPLVKNKNDKLNAYYNLTPWIPPKYIGNYFESFKRLPVHYDMSNWEKVNYLFKF